MQDLLSTLSTPVIVGLILLIALILGFVVWRASRRKRSQEPPEMAVSLGGPVDYTSLPLDEEPKGWRERFARLSLAGKILVVLIPVLALLGLGLILSLLPGGQSTVALPTPVPVTLTVEQATVVRANPLTIDIAARTTGVSDGTQVTAELLEDGQPFAYLNPEQARGTVRNNRVEIQARPVEGAPIPTEGRSHTIVIRGPGELVSAPAELEVPAINRIADTFFGRVAVGPTAEPTTAAPTAAATAAPTATPTAAATPEPTTAALPTGPPAAVINGGNVRRLPIIASDNVIGGVNVEEQVQLLGRTPNGLWYRIRTVRDEIGWVSATLISVPAEAPVPVDSIVTVFTAGPVHEQADRSSSEVDQVNVQEVVLLNQKTADGTWYLVTTIRNSSGWVQASLLGIPEEVAQAVPVAP